MKEVYAIKLKNDEQFNITFEEWVRYTHQNQRLVQVKTNSAVLWIPRENILFSLIREVE